jgi:hypothetical protein
MRAEDYRAGKRIALAPVRGRWVRQLQQPAILDAALAALHLAATLWRLHLTRERASARF